MSKRRVNYGNLVVFLLITFGVIFALLYTQTLIQQNNIVINTMRNELSALEEESAKLELDLVVSEDINAIRTFATTELGMHAPTAGQVIKVSIDHVDNPGG